MTDTTTDLSGGAADAPAAPETDEQIWASLKAAEDEGLPPPAGDTPSGQGDEGEDKTPSEGEDGDDPAGDDDTDGQATIEDLQAHIASLEATLKTQNGRVSARDREINRLRAEIRDAREAITDRKRDAAGHKDRDERLTKVREEYPEVVAPLAEEIEAARKREAAEIQRQERQLQRRQEELATIEAEEEARFLDEHPDGFDVLKQNKEAFKDWLDDQPKVIRDAFETNKSSIVDASAAALVVGKFKLALHEAQAPAKTTPPNRQDPRRQLQMDGARTQRSSPQRSQTAPGEGASEQDWWNYWASEDAKAAKRR